MMQSSRAKITTFARRVVFEAVSGYYEVPDDYMEIKSGALYDEETDTLWWQPRGEISELKMSRNYWKGKERKEVQWRLRPNHEPIPYASACADCGTPLPIVDYLCAACRSSHVS